MGGRVAQWVMLPVVDSNEVHIICYCIQVLTNIHILLKYLHLCKCYTFMPLHFKTKYLTFILLLFVECQLLLTTLK